MILKFGFLRGVPVPLYNDGEGVLVVLIWWLLALVLVKNLNPYQFRQNPHPDPPKPTIKKP